MRKASYWLAAMVGLTLILSACSSEEDINPDNRNLKHITFTAGQAITRTIIDGTDAAQINWQADDAISILDGTSTPRSFKLTSGEGEPEGRFEGMAQETSSYTAVYPCQENGLKLNGNSVEGAWLDPVQTATAGTFDPKANLMMARTKSGDKILQFHNMTAFVKVTPEMDCEQITIVSADSTVALAGTMTLTLDENGNASATVTGNASHQVSLTGNIEAGKTYYIAIAPAALNGGIRMGITTTDGKHYCKDASKLESFTANKVLNLGSISTDKMEWLPYVTFSAKEAQEVKLDDLNHRVINSMDYSTDYGKHWSNFSTDQFYAFGKTTRLMLRGNNPNGTAIADKDQYEIAKYAYFSFKNNVEVACSGDIRTLVKKEKYASADSKEVRYYSLFYSCTQLTSAPELPATELASECYGFMFFGCSALTKAPQLPATELAVNCYAYMFTLCSALNEAPILKAPRLVENCYENMFARCSSLHAVTMLATDVSSAKNCLAGWLQGTEGGILTVATGMSSNEAITKENNTPKSWEIVEQQSSPTHEPQ